MAACLVTGGAGFIGSHVVDLLLGSGHEVVVVDNLATGRLDNLAAHAGNPAFRFVEADVSDCDAIRPHFGGIERVFHLAALADIVPSIQRPLDYHRANVDGTTSVLEAARAAGVKKLVYAASSSCYGIPDTFPTPESAPARPEYPYAFTKWVGEQTVLAWHRMYGLPVISLRFFNVYGPRARTTGTYGAVFGVFLAQKLAGKPYTVVGDGTQTRDFTFVADVAEAVVAAGFSELNGEVLNVGSGATQSVNRLVALLGGPVVHVPKRPGEPDATFADVRKIEALLGWKARTPFVEGVARMLSGIHAWQGAPVWTPDAIQDATKDWFKYLSRPS